MQSIISPEYLKKSGFVPVSKLRDSTIFKSSKGVITLYDDGNVEGIINNTLKEQILNESLTRQLVEMILLVGMGITYFTTDITIVRGVSMEPTYHNLQVIINTKSPKKVDEILVHRGSVVKFKTPDGDIALKRVVGVPGDEIKFVGASLYVNDKLLQAESGFLGDKLRAMALSKKNPKILNTPYSFKLHPNEYYVIGDNSERSVDSRNYGPIEFDTILSVVKK